MKIPRRNFTYRVGRGPSKCAWSLLCTWRRVCHTM